MIEVVGEVEILGIMGALRICGVLLLLLVVVVERVLVEL